MRPGIVQRVDGEATGWGGVVVGVGGGRGFGGGGGGGDGDRGGGIIDAQEEPQQVQRPLFMDVKEQVGLQEPPCIQFVGHGTQLIGGGGAGDGGGVG